MLSSQSVCCIAVSGVLIISKYARYYSTFPHYAFIECIHYPRSTVHEGLGVIFRVLANAMTCKAIYTMLINQIGRFYGFYLPHAREGSERTQSHKPGKRGDETGPLCCGILKYILSGFRHQDISCPAADGVGSLRRGGRGRLLCEMDVNDGCRQRLYNEFLFYPQPKGIDFSLIRIGFRPLLRSETD